LLQLATRSAEPYKQGAQWWQVLRQLQIWQLRRRLLLMAALTSKRWPMLWQLQIRQLRRRLLSLAQKSTTRLQSGDRKHRKTNASGSHAAANPADTTGSNSADDAINCRE